MPTLTLALTSTFIFYFFAFIFSVEIDWDGNGWLKGNEGQTGFYRVNYEQKQWGQLTNQLENGHTVGIKFYFPCERQRSKSKNGISLETISVNNYTGSAMCVFNNYGVEKARSN